MHQHNASAIGEHNHGVRADDYPERSGWNDGQGQHAHPLDAHPIDTATTETHAPAANTHTLDTPLTRGGQTITHVTLAKPAAGALRGTSLSDLVSLNVDALRKVLPRISTPTLTEMDVLALDPADLVALGGIFAGFLMPKALKASMESQNA